MTLSYCSLSCWSSASRVNERCCRIEKVPRTPQATATVSEMARIRRAAIDRSLNMRAPKLREREASEVPRKSLTTAPDRQAVILRVAARTQALAALQKRRLGCRTARHRTGAQDHLADVF